MDKLNKFNSTSISIVPTFEIANVPIQQYFNLSTDLLVQKVSENVSNMTTPTISKAYVEPYYFFDPCFIDPEEGMSLSGLLYCFVFAAVFMLIAFLIPVARFYVNRIFFHCPDCSPFLRSTSSSFGEGKIGNPSRKYNLRELFQRYGRKSHQQGPAHESRHEEILLGDVPGGSNTQNV